MSDRPEYIKCARVSEAEDPTEEYAFMYEVKWVGSADHPSENTWERESLFAGSRIVEDFWASQPRPTSEPNEDGEFNLRATFEATREYISKRIRFAAAAQLPKPTARSTPITSSHKRPRSPSFPSEVESTPTTRRRHISPLVDDDERWNPAPARPMIRPTVGSVLMFKKGGKAFVQDRRREVQDYREFRRRGGIYWQQHQRKERERRLEEARKRAEEAAEAAAEEARHLAEALHEAEEVERMEEEERLAEETARIMTAASERARRAAEWTTPKPTSEKELEKFRKVSPPPMRELLANLPDDDLPDFEEDEDLVAETKPMELPTSSMFGSTSLLGETTKTTKKKKADPYYWAKKLDEERKQEEWLSRHPRFRLLTEIHGVPIDVFMKDVTNEPPRPLGAPTVTILSDSIVDGVTARVDVDTAITRVENGWSPGRSVARLAPVDKSHWAALEVFALHLLVEGKVVMDEANSDGWRPVIFASEEEGIFQMLGASERLSNYRSTLLMTMVKK